MLLSVTIPTREGLSCLLNNIIITAREICLRLRLFRFSSCLYHKPINFPFPGLEDTSNLYQLFEEHRFVGFKCHIQRFR
jgi:hypothetical protein